MDEGTAFIMNDILRTTVSRGIAGAASVSGVPVAGKTGTTSDNYDAWFVGNTPKFSMAVWIGNDVHIELSEGSSSAARMWSRIMTRVMDGRKVGEYPKMPDNVIKGSVSGMSDYFIKGTKPNKVTTGRTTATICEDSGYLATPWCPHTEKESFNTLNGGSSVSGSKPKYYCNLHNIKPGKYPIDPDKKLDKDFDPDGSDDDDKEKEKDKGKDKDKPKPKPDPEPTPEPKPTPTPTPPEPTPPTPPDSVPPVSGAAISEPVATHIVGAYTSSSSSGNPYYGGAVSSDDDILLGRYLLNYYFALKWNGGYG
jgi:membrane peptidoglycan carboxypeptidase